MPTGGDVKPAISGRGRSRVLRPSIQDSMSSCRNRTPSPLPRILGTSPAFSSRRTVLWSTFKQEAASLTVRSREPAVGGSPRGGPAIDMAPPSDIFPAALSSARLTSSVVCPALSTTCLFILANFNYEICRPTLHLLAAGPVRVRPDRRCYSSEQSAQPELDRVLTLQ